MKKKLVLLAVPAWFAAVLICADSSGFKTWDKYLDTSDLRYAGRGTVNLSHAVFIDGCEAPSAVIDSYYSDDGDYFRYDDKGRLLLYVDKDSVSEDSAKTAPDKYLSDNELEELCYDIAMYYLDNDSFVYETSFSSEAGELRVSGTDRQHSGFRNGATVRVDRSGNICSLRLDYNSLERPVDSETREYFDRQFSEYLEEYRKIQQFVSCTCDVFYEQSGTKLYAIYSCTFNDGGGLFCESIGIGKELI